MRNPPSELALKIGAAFQCSEHEIPKTMAEALVQANIAVNTNDFVRAQKLFERAFELEPSESLAIKIARFQALLCEDFLEASGWLTKAFEFNRRSTLAFQIADFCRNEMRDTELAGSWIARAIRAQNTDKESRKNSIQEDRGLTRGEEMHQNWQLVVKHLNPYS